MTDTPDPARPARDSTIVALDMIEGIEVEPEVYARIREAHVDALRSARQLSELTVRSFAEPSPGRYTGISVSAVSLVDMMTAAAAGQCSLGKPPPAEMSLATDANGDLIHRCGHSPAHGWSLDGKRRF